MKKLRIAIIGCKKMGSKHLKCLQDNFGDEVEIAGILNSTPQSTKEKAQELGVPYFNSLQEINAGNVDGVIISTPATNHFSTTEYILSQNIPVLIEKPLAPTMEECDKLIELGQGKKALVGHTENFNPAVIKLKKELDAPIKSISAFRVSQNVSKKDVYVVQELMIHDLAIVNSLIKDDVTKVNISKSDKYDFFEHANVQMQFANGAKAVIEGIIHQEAPARKDMELIDDENNVFKLNFLKKELYKNGERLCSGGDSLLNEMQNFVNMIKGAEAPFVNLSEAKNNVAMCLKAEELIKKQAPQNVLLNSLKKTRI